jgi:hypothetical protein
MSEIEFALVSIIVMISGVALLMFFGIKFILGYLSDIIEELRKLNQNKDDE